MGKIVGRVGKTMSSSWLFGVDMFIRHPSGNAEEAIGYMMETSGKMLRLKVYVMEPSA